MQTVKPRPSNSDRQNLTVKGTSRFTSFTYDTTGENKKKEGDIVFEIYNNKSKNPDGTPRVGKTTVKMESQNLFLLD